LRIAAGSRHRAHVNQPVDSLRSQHPDEVIEVASRMPDRKNPMFDTLSIRRTLLGGIAAASALSRMGLRPTNCREKRWDRRFRSILHTLRCDLWGCLSRNRPFGRPGFADAGWVLLSPLKGIRVLSPLKGDSRQNELSSLPHCVGHGQRQDRLESRSWTGETARPTQDLRYN
jgi:hypothetical protein